MTKRKVMRALKTLDKYFKKNDGKSMADVFEAMMYIKLLDAITDEYVERVIQPMHQKLGEKTAEKITYPITPAQA